MRGSCYWLLGLTLSVSNLMSADVALAESGMKSQASQITVVGTRCVLPAPMCQPLGQQERELVLLSLQAESAEKPSSAQLSKAKNIRDFQVIATDLERKDNSAIVPAKWLKFEVDPKWEVAPKKYISLPLRFDLKQVSMSGEYGGSLIVEHSDGDLTLPVVLKIKDSWHLALLILLIGVVLAQLMAVYQAEGFDQDDVMVKVGQLRSQMRLDSGGNTPENETAKAFQAKSEFYLVDVSNSLDGKAWADARKSLMEAQTVWSRWRKQKTAWVVLYEYVQQEFISDKIAVNSVAGRELKFEVDRLNREMADYETPQKFAETLKPLKEKLQRALESIRVIEKLNALRNDLGVAGDRWKPLVIDLEDRLYAIGLDNAEGLKALGEDAKTLMAEMTAKLPESTTRSGGSLAGGAIVLRGVPIVQSLSSTTELQKASWRLQAFRFLGQGVAIGVLSWAGFQQLYTGNPVFGANASDYVSLLAWGFTAEVTRESASKILQRFKLPGGG